MISQIGLTDRPIDGDSELELAVAATMAVAMRKPELWPLVSAIKPEWFPQHADRILWSGIQFTLTENDGLGELAVLEGWLREHHPKDAKGLLERLAHYTDTSIYRPCIEHDVRMLERHGLRREIRGFGQHLVKLCDDCAPISEVWKTLGDAPKRTYRNGGGDYV